MREISLCGEWRLQGRHGVTGAQLDLPGTVPGCVHTDLLQNGVIENLFERGNAQGFRWIERENWIYTKTFQCEVLSGDACLVFEGLDVYCDVYLNGTWVGHCENMFVVHTFAIDGILQSGENTLEVRFYSPVLTVEGRRPRPAAFTAERVYTRRMQCTYGWDWVERFVTCGIYRPVSICFGRPVISEEDIYIYTVHADADRAELCAELHFRENAVAHIELCDPEDRIVYENDFYCAEEVRSERISIREPLLWYPNGAGSQPLYTFRVCVKGAPAVLCRIGIRTAEVAQLPDAPDSRAYELCRLLQETESGREYDFNRAFSGFTVFVNGQPVWCRGGNWVPCEPFPSAETKTKITALLELSAAAHVNMIRVWGGGIFESQHFYEECDRLGILVTQDFLMACGKYPEDERWFLRELSLEAESAARRLRNHPCLIWWSGDNENAIRGNDLDADYSGRRAALQAIAPALRKYDPRRLFLPSSPYGGDPYASKTRGTTHNTQFLEYLLRFIDQGPIADYREYFKGYLARFIAEEPTMGAISLCSLRKFLSEEDIFGPDLTMWRYHTRTNPGLPKELFDYTLAFAERLLGAFRNGADRLFKLQYIQFEWMRLTMELYRRNHGFCSGVLYWMLDECWPAASGWAFIDYYGIPKASYYAFRKAAGHAAVSFDLSGDGMLSVWAVNDLPEILPAELTVTRIGQHGTILERETRQYALPANAASCVWPAISAAEDTLLVCDLHSGCGTYRTFYKNGILPLEECGSRIRVKQEALCITVEASAYVHAVALDAPAVFTDNFFSLLPGERRCISFRPLTKDFDTIQVKTYTIKEYLS